MINPIVVIILAALILSTLVLYIFIRPKKPIFTGVFLLSLISFVIFTVMIDSAVSNADMMNNFEKVIVSFITTSDINDTLSLEKSFDIFACFDIAIFIATVISMCIEVKAILTSVYSDRNVKMVEQKENDTSAADNL